jgi:hypothetical protein
MELVLGSRWEEEEEEESELPSQWPGQSQSSSSPLPSSLLSSGVDGEGPAGSASDVGDEGEGEDVSVCEGGCSLGPVMEGGGGGGGGAWGCDGDCDCVWAGGGGCSCDPLSSDGIVPGSLRLTSRALTSLSPMNLSVPKSVM